MPALAQVPEAAESGDDLLAHRPILAGIRERGNAAVTPSSEC